MLCVRKITFIDRAEPEAQWIATLKKQWSFGGLIAVRVQDGAGQVLGSTIPMPFVAAKGGETEWGVSWIEPDQVEVSTVPEPVVTAVPAIRAAEGDDVEEADPAPAPAEAPVAQSSAPNTPTTAPAPEEGATTSAAAAVPAAPDGVPVDGSDEGLAKAANEATDDTKTVEVEPREDAAPEAPTPSETPETVAAPPANKTVSPVVVAAPIVSSPVSPVSPMPSPTLPTAATYSSCIPISIPSSSKGALTFDVITLTGTKVASVEADVHAALAQEMSGTPVVRHYSILVTPAYMKGKERPDVVVHAVMEFSVVVGAPESEDVVALAANAAMMAVPTNVAASDTCVFSSRTFYFPPAFLTGTGGYIVSNVLCVESRSNNPVRLEVALPEDLKKIGVLPDKKAVIQHRGERAFFTFTWGVFDAYVTVDETADRDKEGVGLHVLIRDGAENRAPVSIELIGDVPSTTAEEVGPYQFYVNHAKVSNLSSSPNDEATLADILPISLVSRASV